MPPQTTDSPAPTSGVDRPAAGRHRRPESLADTTPAQPVAPRQFRPRVAFTDVAAGRHHAAAESSGPARGHTAAESDGAAPDHAAGDTTGSARHRAGAYGSYGSGFAPRSNSPSRAASSSRAARGSRARHSRQAPAGRSTKAGRAARDRTSGSHRAPGTLPLEAWLGAAKSRPQVLLGTLVAAGLLLTAVPIPQSGGENISVMNAAAQAVVSRISDPEPAPPEKPVKEKPAEKAPPPAAARPAGTPTSAAPTPEATRPVERGGGDKVEQVRVPKGDGPFNSLRTTGSKVVALTFDDGPDPVQTPKILDLLDEYQVKAVFCLVGVQAQAHPELVRRIVDAGHVLCNHTWDHDLAIGKKKPDQIRADLDRTDAAIRAAVPGAPIPYFRAPGGNFTDRLVKVAYGEQMISLYWEVDPRDWEHEDDKTPAQHVQRIIKDVKQQTRPGAIVLSHDFNQPTTIEAYEKLLPWLVDNFEIGLPDDPAGSAPEAPEPGPSGTPATPAPDQPATPGDGVPIPGATPPAL